MNSQLSQLPRKDNLNMVGVSNGVNFSFEEDGDDKKGSLYLEAIRDEDGLKYEAMIILYEEKVKQKVIKVPAVFEEKILNEMDLESGKDVEKISISMKPSPF